jgi:hypothetical protein
MKSSTRSRPRSLSSWSTPSQQVAFSEGKSHYPSTLRSPSGVTPGAT